LVITKTIKEKNYLLELEKVTQEGLIIRKKDILHEQEQKNIHREQNDMMKTRTELP